MKRWRRLRTSLRENDTEGPLRKHTIREMEQMKEKWWSTYVDSEPQMPKGEVWLFERYLRVCQKRKHVLKEHFSNIQYLESSSYYVPHFLIERFHKIHGDSAKQLCTYWKKKHNNSPRTLMMKNRNLGASNYVPSKNKPAKHVHH